MIVEVQEQTATRESLIAQLYRVEGKAEIIGGKVVHLPLTGGDPGFAGDEIFASLREYAKRTGSGRAISDGKGFLVDLSNRYSFSPDAAFFTGANPGMKFYEGAPAFAVEVRSEGDYGKTAERQMANKRLDYFAAGTVVVWDVDLRSENVVKSYHRDAPDEPRVFHRGELADAEPAVPGWTIAVDDLFDSNTNL